MYIDYVCADMGIFLLPISMYIGIIKIRTAKEVTEMKIYERDNIAIQREMTDNRFYDLVRGYRVNESGEPVAFLGKWKVPSNMTEDELFELYRKEGK